MNWDGSTLVKGYSRNILQSVILLVYEQPGWNSFSSGLYPEPPTPGP